MHANYFEGILQLRNPNKKIISFIREHSDNKINKEKNVTNGIDFYFISQQFLKSFGNKLHRSFGGELKTSAKLHTRSRQTSKELYRVNVLLRLPKFQKGDTITYKGEKIKIIGLGKKILAKAENGKKLVLRYSDLD